MNNSMVSGKELKSAIEELINLMMKKSVNELSKLISDFKAMYLSFSDDILYPSTLKDLLRQGIEDVDKESEITIIQRTLYHKCLIGIHNQLALI